MKRWAEDQYSSSTTRGLSRPTPCLRPGQLSQELEGEDARNAHVFDANEVDAKPQRSAVKGTGWHRLFPNARAT